MREVERREYARPLAELVETGPEGDWEGEAFDEAAKLADELAAAGIEVVFDDRAERPGVKFADNDLMGFPFQVIVGKRGLKNGTVELKVRATDERSDVARDEAVARIADMVKSARA